MFENRRHEPVGTLIAVGNDPERVISDQELHNLLTQAYNKLRMTSEVLLVPPDGSRPDAHAPFLLHHALGYFKHEKKSVVPALGTHKAMTTEEIGAFFGANTPTELFTPHDASADVQQIGEISAALVGELTDGLFNEPFPVTISNRIDGQRLVLAFSHIIPHEVMGFAGYTKHVVVGLGGEDTIAKSHEIAAKFGIDETLGNKNTPSRRILQHIEDTYLHDKNIVYVLLVRSPATSDTEQSQADSHGMITRGVFVGNGRELFDQAVSLSQQVNFNPVQPLTEALAYLPAENYHAFWVAMKGCYRLRLAMAEGGTLHVVCPGVTAFGENQKQHDIIARYGYQGWSALNEMFHNTPELQQHSGVWAHLTHGSPPELAPGKAKFKLIVYPRLAPDSMQGTDHFSYEDTVQHGFLRSALRAANLEFGDAHSIMQRFNLQPHSAVGEHPDVYFAGNPAKGLWMTHDIYSRLITH